MKQIRKTASATSRWVLQIIMLILIVGGASFRNLGMSEHSLIALWPELQGFCPFGAVQTLFRGFFDPSYFVRSGYSNLWVLLGVLVITMLFGAVFCSTLCPLGSVQEWMGKLGRRLLKKRYNPAVPKRVNTLLQSLRFILLALLFLSVAGIFKGNPDSINPSYALSHLWTSVVPISAVLVFVTFLILSLWYERPWCRWFCPYGLILGTLGRLSLFTIHRSTKTCIDCRRCDRACPVRIPISQLNSISNSSCNRCMQCVTSCPIPKTLSIASHGSVRIRPVILPVLVLVLFFAPLGVATAASWYRPASSHTVLNSSDQQEFSVDSISPMISLSTLAVQAGIDERTLAALLGLAPDYDFSTLLIDIEEEDDYMDITVRFIRETLRAYLAL